MSLKHKSTLENAESFVYLYFLNTYRINELKENAATSKSLLVFPICIEVSEFHLCLFLLLSFVIALFSDLLFTMCQAV